MITLLVSIFTLSAQASPPFCFHFKEDLNEIENKIKLITHQIATSDDYSGIVVMEQVDQMIKLQKEYETLEKDCHQGLR